jgi:hypothetical protein
MKGGGGKGQTIYMAVAGACRPEMKRRVHVRVIWVVSRRECVGPETYAALCSASFVSRETSNGKRR